MARMHHPSHRRPITFLFLARPATGRFWTRGGGVRPWARPAPQAPALFRGEFGPSIRAPPGAAVLYIGGSRAGLPSTPPRTERSANRPRRSRVHHPRASRTIRAAFLARPARGRFSTLRWRTPRLGELCQFWAYLRNQRFHEKPRFLAPSPLYTYMRSSPPDRRKRFRAREKGK